MTEVTIIIPNYNGKKLLENCIKTLERQTCQEFKPVSYTHLDVYKRQLSGQHRHCLPSLRR